MNPWIYYILNDKMPETDFEDFPFKKLFICFLVVIVWIVVVFCIMKYGVGFNNEYFIFWFLPIFFVSIIIIVFLIVKIFEKEQIMTQEDKEDKYMKVHKTYFDIDMWGNPYEYEVEETVFFDEWADFDD